MMTFYDLLLFLHVTGAVLMFVAFGIESVAVGQLRETTTVPPALTWNSVRRRWVWAGLIAIVVVLASGIGMMALRWGPRPWISAGFAGLLVIVVAGVVSALRARTRVVAALGLGPELSRPKLPVLADSLTFWVRLRAGAGIAVLGLMTLRPGPLGSILMLSAPVAIIVLHRIAKTGGQRSATAGIAEP